MNQTSMDPTIGRFTSEAGRLKFENAYRQAMQLWPSPRTELNVDTPYGVTHIHRYGPKTGVPGVLLPGSASNSTQWFPNVAALGKDRPIYAIDTLGDPGLSTQLMPIHEPTTCAAWLDDVLRALELQRVHLVGHSYGGWVALNQSVHCPGRLASVTLIDPGGFAKVGGRFLLSIFLSALAGLGPRRSRPLLARKLHSPVLLIPELLSVIFAGAGAFRTKRPAPEPLTDEELGGIRTPMLVLLGEKSTLHRAHDVQRRLAETTPAAVVEVMADTGHGPNLERPEEVNQVMNSFFAKIDRQFALSA